MTDADDEGPRMEGEAAGANRGRRLAKIARDFDAVAGRYDAGIGFAERRILGHHRRWAVQHARGDVLEIACGTGLNLPLYRYGAGAVTSLLGVDVSSGMLQVARERIAAAGFGGDSDRIEVREGDVEDLAALGVADDSVDTVVSTLTVCTIPDPGAALTEALRVLRPGGRAVLVEHGPARGRLLRGLMRAADPLSARFASDHLLRDPALYLQEAGFAIESVERRGIGGVVFRVLARKP